MTRLLRAVSDGLGRSYTVATFRAVPRSYTAVTNGSVGCVRESHQHEYVSSRPYTVQFGSRVRARPRQIRLLSASTRRYMGSGWRLSRRWRSMWHRPGCKWVTSTEDPKTAPRDKDCPACQEEEGYPFELSRRELIWERQFRDMKELLNKDAYEVLFGMSNRRLCQIGWDRSLWRRGAESSGFRPVFPSHLFNEDAAFKSSEGNTPKEPVKPSEESQVGKKKSSDPPGVASSSSYSSRTSWEAYTPSSGNGVFKWETAGVTDGQPFSTSGEWEFDPVTMRRVPKQAKEAETPKESNPVEEPKNIAVKRWEGPSNAIVNLEKKDGKSLTAIPREAVPKSMDAAGSQPLRGSEKFAQDIERPPRDLKDRKTQLERSWLKDTNSKDHKHSGSKQLHSTKTEDVLPTSAKELHAQRRLQSQQYMASRWKEMIANHEDTRIARHSVFRKLTPLKQMSVNELSTHRRALLNAFDLRKSSPSATSAVDNLLKKEVENQKIAMAALENKWHRRETAAKGQSTVNSLRTPTSTEASFLNEWLAKSIEDQEAASVASKRKQSTTSCARESGAVQPLIDPSTASRESQQQSSSIPGEGDLCSNVPKFQSDNRWYKKAAPHANMPKTIQSDTDAELVKDIRQIYESRYGKIDANHSQARAIEREISVQNLEEVRDKWLRVLDVKRQRMNDLPSGQQSEQAKIKILAIIDDGRRQLRDLFSEAKAAAQTPAQLKEAMSRTRAEIKNRLFQVKTNLGEPEAVTKPSETVAREIKETPQVKTPPTPIQPSLERMARLNEKNKEDRNLYKVLAYDPSNHKMYEAGASSTFSPPTEEIILSVADAVMRLHAPAKFLPYFEKYQNKGYEIVSAGKNVLVFKRVRRSTETDTEKSEKMNPEEQETRSSKTPKEVENAVKERRQRINPIDLMHACPTPQTGNFASPTGFVNHDVFPDPEPRKQEPEPHQNLAGRATEKTTVSRHEPVFSGNSPNHWTSKTTISEDSLSPHAYINRLRRAKYRARTNEGRPRRRRFSRFLRALKRVFFIGAWTAACCYATGVVIEYFRNGPRHLPPASEGGESSRTGERRGWADTRGVGQAGYHLQGSRPITGSTAPSEQQSTPSRYRKDYTE